VACPGYLIDLILFENGSKRGSSLISRTLSRGRQLARNRSAVVVCDFDFKSQHRKK
jgi:hypothetical protein